jgi:hypothetical protein
LDSEINKGTQRGSVDQILEGEQTDVWKMLLPTSGAV